MTERDIDAERQRQLEAVKQLGPEWEKASAKPDAALVVRDSVALVRRPASYSDSIAFSVVVGAPPPVDHRCAACGEDCYQPGPCVWCEEAAQARDRETKRRHAIVHETVRSFPRTFRWASFAAKELGARVLDSHAIELAKIAVVGEGVVTLTGVAGAGKTVLACAIVRARSERDAAEGLFIPVHRLGLARTQHALGDGEAPLVLRAMRVPLCILDDIGSEDPRSTSVADVLHERHAAGLFTVVTSGMSRADLLERYGAGIVRRLTEPGRGAVIKLASRPAREGTR